MTTQAQVQAQELARELVQAQELAQELVQELAQELVRNKVYLMSFGKKDFIKNISIKAQVPKSLSHKITESFFDLLKNESSNSNIKIANFGSFYRRDTPERIGRNPKTNMEYLIPIKSKLFFKASNKIKNTIN
jgi:nucleoid DNA-binding protein